MPAFVAACVAVFRIGFRLEDRATVRIFTKLQQNLANAVIKYQSAKPTISPSCRTSGQFFCEVLDDLRLQRRGSALESEPLPESANVTDNSTNVHQSSSLFADHARAFTQQAKDCGWTVERVAEGDLAVEMRSTWQYNVSPPEDLLQKFAEQSYGKVKSQAFFGMTLTDCLYTMQDEFQDPCLNYFFSSVRLGKSRRAMDDKARLAVSAAQEAVLWRAAKTGGRELNSNPACVGLFDIVWKNGLPWPSDDMPLLHKRPASTLLRRIYLYDMDLWALRMPEHANAFNLSMQAIYGGLQGELEGRMDISPARFKMEQKGSTPLLSRLIEDLTRKALAQAAVQSINGFSLKPKSRLMASAAKTTTHEFRIIPEKILMPLIVEIALMDASRKYSNDVLRITRDPNTTDKYKNVASLLGDGDKQSQCGEEILGRIYNDMLHPLTLFSTVDALLELVQTRDELDATKKVLNQSERIRLLLHFFYDFEIPSQTEDYEKLHHAIEMKSKDLELP